MDWDGKLVAVLPSTNVCPVRLLYAICHVTYSLKTLQYFIQNAEADHLPHVFHLWSRGIEALLACCCYSGKPVWRNMLCLLLCAAAVHSHTAHSHSWDCWVFLRCVFISLSLLLKHLWDVMLCKNGKTQG